MSFRSEPSILPIEIWMHFIQLLRPVSMREGNIQALQSLSLVSHDFESLARPYVFERISFLQPSECRVATSRIEGLNRFLEDDPRRVKWTKEFLVQYQSGWDFDVISAVSQYFTRLSDVRGVWIFHFPLSPQIYRYRVRAASPCIQTLTTPQAYIPTSESAHFLRSSPDPRRWRNRTTTTV